MRMLGAVIIFICTLLFAVIGSLLVAFSFNLFTTQNLTGFLSQTFQLENINYVIGGIGLFLIIASLCITQITLGKMQREKTIAVRWPGVETSDFEITLYMTVPDTEDSK